MRRNGSSTGGDGGQGKTVVKRRGPRTIPSGKLKNSSRQWLQRSLNDPYKAAARTQNYASRAAYKLIELDDRYKLLRGKKVIVDLGAAPGGWCQVIAERAATVAPAVIAVDKVPFPAVAEVRSLVMDVTAPDTITALQKELRTGWKNKRFAGVDLLLSDMASAATGNRATDHLRNHALYETAWTLGKALLCQGGALCFKSLYAGVDKQLFDSIKAHFTRTLRVKLHASHKGSGEQYLLALGYKNNPPT